MLAALFGGWRIWAAAGLATLLLAGAAYVKGYADARARCSERELRIELASARADLARQKAAADETAASALAEAQEADQRERAIMARMKELEAQAATAAAARRALEAEVSDVVQNRCALDDPDIALDRRLRQGRGR